MCVCVNEIHSVIIKIWFNGFKIKRFKTKLKNASLIYFTFVKMFASIPCRHGTYAMSLCN